MGLYLKYMARGFPIVKREVRAEVAELLKVSLRVCLLNLLILCGRVDVYRLDQLLNAGVSAKGRGGANTSWFE